MSSNATAVRPASSAFTFAPSTSVCAARGLAPFEEALLAAAGFFIYGPQALIGIIASNLATKRAAATAAGFTGLFGYASTIVSGWGLGLLVEKAGWHIAFGALLALGAVGTVMFILAWRAPAHGYRTSAS